MGILVSFYLACIWLLTGISQCKGSPSKSNNVVRTIGLCPCNQTDYASVTVYLDIPPMADIFRRAQDLSRELTIDKNRVSAIHRQKTSAPDDRLSSKSMGVVGGIVIMFVVGSVITMDLITMKAKRSRKKNGKSKSRKSSNTSSSTSDGTTTTSASSTNCRRFSSASTAFANSIHIGINDLTLCNDNDNNNILNYLPTVSTKIHSPFSGYSNKTTARSKSFTSTNNIVVCCQVAAAPRHLRSHSFSVPRKMSDTEFGLPVSSLQPEKDQIGSTKTPDPVPDIIVTCGVE